jgi:hypothetical protein
VYGRSSSFQKHSHQNFFIKRILNLVLNKIRDLSICLRTCCKRNLSKIPFYEKIKMFKKGPFVVESFVIVGSFDYDHTQIKKQFKASITIPSPIGD